MSEFDWVGARGRWTVDTAFRILKEIVQRDVGARNKQLGRQAFSITDHGSSREISPDGDFTVVHPRGYIYFVKQKHCVSVEQFTGTRMEPKTAVLMKMYPEADDSGDWFLRDGARYRAWQVSRRALENVFFG